VDQQAFLAAQSPPAYVGIYVATIFGSAFFFDLFWPERQQSGAVKLAWKVCSVLACMMTLACALAYTYIVASKSAWVSGVDQATAQRDLELYGGSPLRYAENGRAVASVVLLWLGMVFTCVRYVAYFFFLLFEVNGMLILL
jgi:hypothetical protein